MNEEHPSQIGNYRIIKTLGEGAMARVYLAERVATGGFRRKCALKVVHPEFARDSKFIELMQREARLGALLEHPNIVNTISHGDFDGIHFIDLEYVEGKTLAEFLEMMTQKGKSGLELSFCLQIILPILRALDYAHNFTDESWEGPPGMVHRDLKPANIMLSNQAVVKIMDFGIAKAKVSRSNLTNIGQVRGTPVYMAPEQVTGKAVDGYSDQFAAASVFYELVTGERLFSGINLISVMQSVSLAETSAAEQLLEKACPGLGAVLGRMWERLPENRYNSCSDAAAALADLLATYLEEPSARKPRRRPARAQAERKNRTAKSKPMFGLLSALTGRSPKKGRKRLDGGAQPKRRRRKKKRVSRTTEAMTEQVLESAEDWSEASAMLQSDTAGLDAVNSSPEEESEKSPQDSTPAPATSGPEKAMEGLGSTKSAEATSREAEDEEGKTISVLFMNVIFEDADDSDTAEDITTIRNEPVLSQSSVSVLTPIEEPDQSLREREPNEEEQHDPQQQPKAKDSALTSMQAHLAQAALEPADDTLDLPVELEDTQDLFQSNDSGPVLDTAGISDTLDLNPLARPHTVADQASLTGGPQEDVLDDFFSATSDIEIGDEEEKDQDGIEGQQEDDQGGFFTAANDIDTEDSKENTQDDIDDFFSDSFDED